MGVLGSGDPVVLVHGTPYSSFLWRDIAPALARTRTVFVFDHLGFGQSDQREGQDLSLAAHARNFARLLDHWELSCPASSPTTSAGPWHCGHCCWRRGVTGT
ncbi:alpha/beta fold hydrolase [Streptomyces sp. MS1.AVA.1]|uniref:Alpha/beta fold hydrolase n=1 Tax=Streptomyces machairae TaxID=3134109 RepID=A0ABU8UWD2_9ACTN